ncbi:GntR family transcriptional regulator [Macrococcus hajekii]|uniref:GntR family transcriptional regulator n=1 Tax=Macrococcus hajekii TaxID=198482 RepID=A0A4R6BJK7_9STAP|nr:GntR family transcriptional regulator [Macrococcus hajekii]TDM01731.1 GntR family transcriptional regulator [Macrococcus hajekii]GGB06910.1 GntR family transcriptional regulator [Macrococcus hajekii]
MNIQLNQKSDKPIYEQLKSEIIRLIMCKELREGESLLSMRALAKDLGISVITTKRAYKELEDLGYINSVPGKGTFVAKGNQTMIREQSLRRLELKIKESIELSRQLSIERSEYADIVEFLWEE